MTRSHEVAQQLVDQSNIIAPPWLAHSRRGAHLPHSYSAQ